MSARPYALDDRTAREILAELRALAAAEAVPGMTGAGPADSVQWSEILFPEDESHVAEPSRALLGAVAQLYPGLLHHLSTLPSRALVDWLERRLGIARLPVVPDTVVAVPKPDPKRLPVVVPAGTALRGGRDAAGNERRYVTTETLAVLGTEILGVRSYGRGPEPSGESKATWDDRSEPFEPFPSGVDVPHYADIFSDLIAFQGGELSVTLTFDGAQGKMPKELRWCHSTPERLEEALSAVPVSANAITLRLAGSCLPLASDPGGRPFIRAELRDPPYPDAAFAFSFKRVMVSVARDGLKPDAGFYNDGLVDITREFQPFGPVPRRGDSFYIQSEEAFGKPLQELGVAIGVPGDVLLWDAAWGKAMTDEMTVAIAALKGEPGSVVQKYFGGRTIDPDVALVDWQANDGTKWTTFSSMSKKLASLPHARRELISPQLVEVAGVTGHMIRAFLNQGDFGWVAYQKRVANFAAEAAKANGSPQASDLIPPDPPLVSTITISYVTKAIGADRVQSVDGWLRRELEQGDPLFFQPPTASPPMTAMGEIGIGLGVAPEALGSTLSLFVEIDPASACTTSSDPPATAWEYWAGRQGWRSLDVIDGTSGLRQAGLVRFVASLDWATASPEFSADTGRWVRIVTNLPDRLGTIRAIVPDAVTAEYRSQLPDPATDATPATPLAARELKGLIAPIAGIKTFTNPLPGSVGRGPEPDARYVTRAAERTRHRNRAVQAWDFEAMVSSEFPEVATVRCLPHTDAAGDDVPGSVGLVVVPWSNEPQPAPSVALAERILSALRGRTPVHATPVVLCPLYQGVSVQATIVLRPNHSAAESKRTLGAAIDDYLHPAADAPFGRELFASTLVRFLESRPEVDHVTTFSLLADPCPTGDGACRVEKVSVDACRGLVASAGNHLLTLIEQL